MIAYLEGKLIARWDRNCILMTNDGTGYQIGLTGPTFAALPATGEKCALFISLVTREDALELYGFTSLEEKRAFEILTGISKVGARTALAILSVFQPEDLCQIANCGNYQQLTAVSGIGNKTAQHIFLELKYKIPSLGKSAGPARESLSSPVLLDAVAALVNLGYAEEESGSASREILDAEPDLDLGSLIRKALKKLAKGKVDER